MSIAIQGMDTIPRAIAERFSKLFSDHLPGWSVSGAYNFQPGATTQGVAAQLKIPMHMGSHPSINNPLIKLLDELNKGTAPELA